MKAKRNILAATILASSIFLSIALAAPTSLGPNSPAQNLFEQASFYLKFHYHGFSNVNLEILVARYKQELDRVCSGQGEKCSYETARPVLSRMLNEVRDGHTYFISPENYAESLVAQQGSSGPSDKPLIGWQLEGTVGGVLVAELIADGPAQLGGVHRFDKIIGMNGIRFTGGQNGIQQIRAASAAGQTTRFEIARGQARFEVTLTPKILLSTDLLPYLEAKDAFDQFGDINLPYTNATNQAGAKNKINSFLCQTNPVRPASRSARSMSCRRRASNAAFANNAGSMSWASRRHVATWMRTSSRRWPHSLTALASSRRV